MFVLNLIDFLYNAVASRNIPGFGFQSAKICRLFNVIYGSLQFIASIVVFIQCVSIRFTVFVTNKDNFIRLNWIRMLLKESITTYSSEAANSLIIVSSDFIYLRRLQFLVSSFAKSSQWLISVRILISSLDAMLVCVNWKFKIEIQMKTKKSLEQFFFFVIYTSD